MHWCHLRYLFKFLLVGKLQDIVTIMGSCLPSPSPPHRPHFQRKCANWRAKLRLTMYNGFAQQNPRQPNLLFSPLCAEIALLKLYAGTADPLMKSHISDLLEVDAEALIKTMSAELAEIKEKETYDCDSYSGKDENYRLYLANILVLSDDIPVNQKYADDMRSLFNALCLSRASVTCTGSLEDFLRKQTMGKVAECDLKSPYSLPDTATFSLLNAVHFHANWHRTFRELETQKNLPKQTATVFRWI
ncbi:neuroserpin-like [Paramacrobiotus metropolitanus]|uniref:neuroserpin-like n=1 Tax=Paramacrobiotus metropolitanus TaxID=2943436 RepID=UPI0024456444|nr:neuroserpin-like [Paramacrobiotus metropolitanus]